MAPQILLCRLLVIWLLFAFPAFGSKPVPEAGLDAGGLPPHPYLPLRELNPQIDPTAYRRACPDYTNYARTAHQPFSDGPLQLPSQRPAEVCRTFKSNLVENVIEDLVSRMKDPDLAKIFQNAFPNTLDTTVRWHVDGVVKKAPKSNKPGDKGKWEGPQSFIVTGDINAEWLRDSTNQLAQYQSLAKSDPAIKNLILGAINTQAEYVIQSPYCNAFQPPPPSRLQATENGMPDVVHPTYEPNFVFECKYEIDSLANFLSLANQFYNSTGSTEFLNIRFFAALQSLLNVLDQQTVGTFNEGGSYVTNAYTFKRHTWTGTETLNLDGIGNPLASNTGLIRSAFRPSDDATIFGYFIPGNAMMAVELSRLSSILESTGKHAEIAQSLSARSEKISKAIYAHAVVKHPVFGDVFAYEVDGYGSHLLMDDANIPSLLSLPLLGFLSVDDEIYQNTRRMILSQRGNPYYLTGRSFHGIGGPHIGLENAWPMSLLVQAMTSTNKTEITRCLEAVKNVSSLGLIHESVNVKRGFQYTRSWFAWANSVFAQTILDLAGRMPDVLFGEGAKRWSVEDARKGR